MPTVLARWMVFIFKRLIFAFFFLRRIRRRKLPTVRLLLSSSKISLSPCLTHRFNFETNDCFTVSVSVSVSNRIVIVIQWQADQESLSSVKERIHRRYVWSMSSLSLSLHSIDRLEDHSMKGGNANIPPTVISISISKY